MYSEKNIIEMAESYNCLRLDTSYIFQVEVYKDKISNEKFFKIGGDVIPFEKFKVGQLAKLISFNEKFEDPDKLSLWQVDVDESKLNRNSTEGDIKNLGGMFMKRQSNFTKYFQDGYKPADGDNINIVVVIATTSTELGRKRPITEEVENLELKKLKWDTNGAIRIKQRDSVYFVDPLPLSDPLLNKIREGDFVAMHGSRASGKSTRVFNVIEQLEKEGYLCIY